MKLISRNLIRNFADVKKIGPGGLRAPCVLARAMRRLAIVITIVQSFFLSLLFFSLRLLLLTHFGETPVCEIIFAPIFWHNQKNMQKNNIFSGEYIFQLCQNIGGNKFSHTGDSPKWVKSKKRREKKKEREKERLNNGDNNGQATHGARKHAWRTQARMAHASRLGQKKD